MNLKKLPPIFESNCVVVKELKWSELPWDGNVRITLDAVRVVFNESNDGINYPTGDRIKSIKYDLIQLVMTPSSFNGLTYFSV